MIQVWVKKEKVQIQNNERAFFFLKILKKKIKKMKMKKKKYYKDKEAIGQIKEILLDECIENIF